MHKLAHGSTLTREETPLFKLDSLSFHYPNGPTVLHNIDLEIFQGDKLAIVGANGSGKSTLAKHLNGLINGNPEKIYYKGEPFTGRHLVNSRFEIGLLFQDPDDHLFCNTLYDDVAFGPLNQGKTREETEHIVENALAKVDLHKQQNQPAHYLSYGQKKRAALAAILAMNPNTLILDEPTVNLDTKQVRIIVELLKQFRGTIICISHDLFFLKEICQRALVLKQGSVHHDYSLHELMEAPAALREHGLDFSFRFFCCGSNHDHIKGNHTHPATNRPTPAHAESRKSPDPLIQFKNFSYIYPNGTVGLNAVDLTIQKGERLALLGENGAGKSTLANCLTGIASGTGSYIFNGRTITAKNRKRLWKDVGIIFQDSADQLFCPTCREEVAFGLKQRKLPESEIRQRVHEALALVHLEGFAERVPLDMSGGERKRLAIASVICLQPQVLIMDEPTAGLDPQGEEMFLNIIQELDMTQILISHDLFLIAQHCRKAVIMTGGTIACECPVEALVQNRDLEDTILGNFNLSLCKLQKNSHHA
jgi:energy-coupling factor transporter ATP-binding protein EcfA2